MILESVRYYVRYASFCIFRSPEIVSVFKGVRHFCFRLTDKFSRLFPPPSHSHLLSPRYTRLCRLVALGGFGFAKIIVNCFCLPTRCDRFAYPHEVIGELACKRQVRVSSTEIILRCSKSSYQLFNCIQKLFEYSTLLWHIIKT